MKKLKILWQNLDQKDRRVFVAELSLACQVSPYTVSGWVNADHEPQQLLKEKIVEYVREHHDKNFTL